MVRKLSIKVTINTLLLQVISGYRFAIENQKFPVRVRLLVTCRDELSAVITWLMPECLQSELKW